MPEKPAPNIIGGYRVICYTTIDDRHRFTGKTKQVVRGKLKGAMSGLAICQPGEAQELYLFGCDADWNVVTDTWHQSLDEAKDAAEFQYEGVSATWNYFS
jgi:hypothetical protein